MKLLSSTLISKERELFCDWSVTPQSMVIRSEDSILQARTWMGELIWKVDIATVKQPDGAAEAGNGNEEKENVGPAFWGQAEGGGSIFVGTKAGMVQELDLANGSLIHTYPAETTSSASSSPVRCLAAGNDSSGSPFLVSGFHDCTIQVWDRTSKLLRFKLTGAFTPDEKIFCFQIKDDLLIATGGPKVAIWDLLTGKLQSVFEIEGVRLFASVLVGEDFVVAGGSGSHIWIFDRKTSKVITKLRTTARVINGLILYRPTILLSTDTSGIISLWDLTSFSLLYKVKVHDHSVLTCTLDAVHSRLLTGGKEGGAPGNACGLDCSLKSLDLEALMRGEGEIETETKTEMGINPVVNALGGNSVTIWKVEIVGEKLAVILERRGRMALEVWSLVDR